ncbi:DUF3426 domain-containing protein [Herbaspirillum seropedicae]|uniref:DUF3426 domain-containing protein n=1 Tax=Herbaspirillum seropedicae TaxID=964 RepID=UPI003F8D14A3
MALATQCPHCLTIFRVVSDQLKLRGGLVRCGSCRQVFNGNDYLVEASVADGHYQPAPGSKAQAGVMTPSAAAAPATPTPAPAPVPASPMATRGPAPQPSAPVQAIPISSSTAPVRAEPPLPVQVPAPVPAAIPVIAEPKVFRSPTSPGYIPDLGAPLKSPAAVDKDKRDEADALPPFPVADEITTAPAEGAALLRRSSSTDDEIVSAADIDAAFGPATPRLDEENEEDVHHLRGHDDEPDQLSAAEHSAADDSEDDAELPGFVRRVERRERAGRVLKVIMMILAGVMVPVLLLQALYYWRNPLAEALPPVRPMLNGMCVALHCSVGLPAEIDRLSLEANELQVVPPNQNVYALTVVMRNRGPGAQAWPHLELTLNNDDEKAVVRRVFRPRDYLPDARQIDRGIAADSEQQIKLNFELKDALVSGYRVYLFYP